MKDKHSHRPYIRAYLIYGVLTAILMFVVMIPFVAIAKVIWSALGQDLESLTKAMPWCRSGVAAILGYFVFRMAIRKEILKGSTEPEEEERGTEHPPGA